MGSRHGPISCEKVAYIMAYGEVPCGPDMGYHVAPIGWIMFLVKILEFLGINRVTYGMGGMI
jgi:hypothetical protein